MGKTKAPKTAKSWGLLNSGSFYPHQDFCHHGYLTLNRRNRTTGGLIREYLT
jgi:hypothetical protein